MKYILLFYLMMGLSFSISAQSNQQLIPQYYSRQDSFDDSLKSIIRQCGLDSLFDAGEDGMERISFAVIDLSGDMPVLGGYHESNLIYPASVYKMYVAMEILKQVSDQQYSLFKNYVVQSPNDVDHISEIRWDPRPLLRSGDTVTVNYLLDLMITRSDNSAANCLIDIADRKNINKTMQYYGWHGSEVTRKFLSRKLEAPGYDTVASTMTNALHAADFMYKVYSNTLVNSWVSQQMKVLLGRQLDTTKLSVGLPSNAMFYHKTGWWSYFTNDVGIVNDGKVKYIIALFTPVTEVSVRPRLKEVSRRVFELVKRRHDEAEK